MKFSKWSKRIAAVSFSAMLVLSAAGCANKPSADAGNPSGSNPSESGTQDSGNAGNSGAQKLTIAIPQNPNVEDFKTNKLTQWLEKDMNVDIEFVLLPATADDANTKVSLWVSSNSKLPDVLCLGLTDTVVQDYVSKGVVKDLTSYYEDPQISPNFHSTDLDAERDTILNSIRFADGNIYSLYNYSPFPWNEASYRCWINQEWLDQLGMEAPATTDEFRAILEAFKNTDMNGNGKTDEIPMMTAKSGYGMDPTTFLMNAFIQTTPGADYMVVKDGKLSPAFTTEEWKKGLEYMYGLVQDGLLSPLSFTQDSTQLKTLLSASEATIGVTCAGSTSMFGSDPAAVNRMKLLEPLTGPDGACGVAYQPSTASKNWYITKDASDPELAFKCGDWFLGSDQSWYARYGEKDVQWTDDPEIAKDYLPMFEQYTPVKYVGTIYGSQNIWGQPQNVHWQGANPMSTPLTQSLYQSFAYKEDPDLADKTNYNTVHLEIYYDKIPKEYVTKFLHTDEELDQLSEYSDMMDYVKSSMAEFITGNRSLNQWEDYLKTLDKMGLDDYVALRQSGFDRVSAK